MIRFPSFMGFRTDYYFYSIGFVKWNIKLAGYFDQATAF